ncbi:TAXI family TRAP transporter solute-binding subunit [Allorhizobium sp. BGMRC 0089]|uniref:TAXI family TRAP transporter solute-binding subunit n=1 Tax=Allorhizobium sonneratiae TaxID=2934936 RepID=UPI0020334637|nr:TAXI family TRAP transporter solute-binding subunit [Allorhizobium sonneratiae]MCM2293905.1 TAXI family TRAP transporter solute-binding subunit [Allorhizobium sonneratiae]
MTRKTFGLLAAVSGIGLLLGTGATFAKDMVKLGAQEPGGSFYTYAATFAKLIDDSKTADMQVDIIPRGGAFGNPTAVDRGMADFGFTTSNTAVWAKEGLEDVYKGKKAENIRQVTSGMQTAYTMVIARKAFVDEHHIKTVADLFKPGVNTRIGLKPAGSQVPIIADFLFKAEGTSLEKLRKAGEITQASSGQLTSMLTDGRLDVYIESAPAGQATVTEMTLTNDMVFVPFTQKDMDALAAAGLPKGAMPAGSFRGQDSVYVNPVSYTMLIAGKSVSDKDVYNFLKTLVDNRDYIAKTHAPLKEWDPVAGCHVDAGSPPLHPGAARLCKELGAAN